MGFQDVIKKSVLEGFTYTDFSTVKIAVTLGVTFLIALYIFFVYRFATKRTFYNRDFNVSMAVISLVTAGIVMAMQSNLVISLGMVGALSIVRFRTAIKEPMDLLFLFWSISTGIVCGAGLYELAILVALAATAGMLFLQALPMAACPYLLILKLSGSDAEAAVITLLKEQSPKYKLDSKSVRQGVTSLIFEIRVKDPGSLVDQVSQLSGVQSVSLMHHSGEVKS